MPTTPPTDWVAIVDVLNRYGEALDDRRWDQLDAVFLADAVGEYGDEAPRVGRDAIVSAIRGHLEGCGPSQHLLGSYRVDIDGDVAHTSHKIRAFHVGAGERAALEPFESLGTYRDDLVRTAEGWRIARRRMEITLNRGDMAVLQPAQPSQSA